MNEKTILANPLTQRAEAVKQLIEFVTGKPCEELPANFALVNGAQLTKSSKGDVFYVTTPIVDRASIWQHLGAAIAWMAPDHKHRPTKPARESLGRRQRPEEAYLSPQDQHEGWLGRLRTVSNRTASGLAASMVL
jgi:hypothetical protein